MANVHNPYAPPQAEVADIATVPMDVDAAPPLWNPRAAANWSLFFTPIFGALLHMKNWQALGQPEKAAQARMWAWGTLVFMVVVAVLAAVLPQSRALGGLSRAAGLGLLFGWYFSSGKAQQTYVTARFGKDYPRKGWTKPLLLGLAGMIGFVAAAVVVGVILGLLLGAR